MDERHLSSDSMRRRLSLACRNRGPEASGPRHAVNAQPGINPGLFVVALTLAALAQLVAQPVAHAQETASVRFGFGAHLALGGDAGVEYDGEADTRRMRVGGGLFVNADISLGRHFLFRPTIQWRSIRANNSTGRTSLFLVGLGLGVRHRFVLDPSDRESLAFEPLLVVGLGVAVVEKAYFAVPARPASFDEPSDMFGLDSSVRAGVIMWFGSRAGVSLQVGFERADFFPLLLSGDRGRVHVQQAVVDLGVVLSL